jgi:hypothetical protein
LPSGLKATLLTSEAWPRKTLSSWPLLLSHTFTARSVPVEASRFPSGLKATRFSSDRTIAGYAEAIWKARPCPVP